MNGVMKIVSLEKIKSSIGGPRVWLHPNRFSSPGLSITILGEKSHSSNVLLKDLLKELPDFNRELRCHLHFSRRNWDATRLFALSGKPLAVLSRLL